jgi:hypothetical protein
MLMKYPPGPATCDVRKAELAAEGDWYQKSFADKPNDKRKWYPLYI